MSKATDKPLYSNIAQIRKANADAGYYWFSSTLRFFDGKVESRVYDDGQGHRLWVDSIQDHDRPGGPAPREYKIAVFDVETASINRPEGVGYFRTAREAEHYLIDNLL